MTETEKLDALADEIIDLVLADIQGCENPNCEPHVEEYTFGETTWIKESDLKGVKPLRTLPHASGKYNVCEISHPNAGKTVLQVLREKIKTEIKEFSWREDAESAKGAK